ncbi:MAG: hypothetical protein LKG79_00470 [Furfurilactobacillus sp.]|jgi:hypothetical protein|uniref:Uncharacterized protein n=1 Tax=Furfurilactobacillus milii TaxID=2888272 RepID=A0ABT6D6J3_9LACO|nr:MULTISPECIES: hypothetical protein [Furfurilactobacillus]MCF6159748.1 hypothetical protein [Furfurilactobacillus milii]MCF6163167.1 hypothetical protein [Furfurilactobacillus milii]MCF6165884.1 hypothetical protein [Furfurilactobacillus rossiae]MCF6419129.1 hypothetical protein [Furfurilactobacillus milii]MCH4010996.1 hypothetical protein [Furfurilactobacillus sp.]
MQYVTPLSQTDKKLFHQRGVSVDDPLAGIKGLSDQHLTGLVNGQQFDLMAYLNNVFVCQLQTFALTEDYNVLEQLENETNLVHFSNGSQALHNRLKALMVNQTELLKDYELLHEQVRANYYAAEPDDLSSKQLNGTATNLELAFHALLGMSADSQWLMEVGMQTLRVLNPVLTTEMIQQISASIMMLVEKNDG